MTSNELKKIIYSLGITQTEFAKKCGMSRQAVYSWTRGTRKVPGYIRVICDKLLGENNMKTYEFYAKNGPEWIERNIAGLCGDCEMVRAPEYDDHSDAYVVDGYVLHVNHSAVDTIESLDDEGEVIERCFLDNK